MAPLLKRFGRNAARGEVAREALRRGLSHTQEKKSRSPQLDASMLSLCCIDLNRAKTCCAQRGSVGDALSVTYSSLTSTAAFLVLDRIQVVDSKKLNAAQLRVVFPVKHSKVECNCHLPISPPG